jgi:hypothetical protein
VRGRQWHDLTTRQRVMLVVLGAAQLTLSAVAWSDLARRPPDLVRGPKVLWRWLIAVNWVGPLSYFAVGRRTG